MDEILNELIAPMKRDHPKNIPTLEVLNEYYLERCRANLHVVLCFSPVGEKFRNRYVSDKSVKSQDSTFFCFYIYDNVLTFCVIWFRGTPPPPPLHYL